MAICNATFAPYPARKETEMWKEKLKLNPGETLRQESHRTKGTMAEEDIYEFSILNAQGQVVGSVTHRDLTTIKGFHRRQSVEQRDANHKLIVEEYF